jgi:gamma-tubulin complex component 3
MATAIRSTTAVSDDPEILNHLDVRLFDPYDGDSGWDIFTLQYIVKGPLSTMLEPSMSKYQTLFKPLWKTKHVEFVLSKIWKDQILNAKSLRSMRKELNSVTYRLHLYTAEMIHFIHQMQYYILFEVIECSWAALQRRVLAAAALDDILEAHHDFLESIRIGTFLDEKNNALYVNLESVYRGIMKLEEWQENFYAACFKEQTARQKLEDNIVKSEKTGDYGVIAEQRLERDEEEKIFEQSLFTHQKTLESIGNEYGFSVRRFLLMLTSTNDHNLQLFGIRLDFNEYYKKRDQRLNAPLTYEHMRMSSFYPSGKNSSGLSLMYNTPTQQQSKLTNGVSKLANNFN